MILNIRKTLASIAIVGTVGLSGCGYEISQQGVDQLTEKVASYEIEVTDKYLEIGQLLKNRDYEKAQSVLDDNLRQQKIFMLKSSGAISMTDKISRPVAERICKSIDAEVEKVDNYLK